MRADRNEPQPPIFVRFGIEFLQTGGHGVNIGLGLLQSHALLQPPDGAKEMEAADLHSGILKSERRPYLGLLQHTRRVRRDAHHSVAATVELDSLADDLRVASETPLPKPLADDRHPLAARLLFFRQKRAALNRLDAQSLEEICRHRTADNALRLAGASQVERVEHNRRQLFKASALGPVIEEIWRRCRSAIAPAEFAPTPNQPLGLRKRQRAQKNGVDQAENRRVRADPQAERENGNQSEDGLLRQNSRAVAQVL